MTAARISSGQMKRLQTLYGKACAHTQEGRSREERLQWASQLLGRPMASFSGLTREEAQRLIDALQGQLGVPQTQRRRRDREAARRRGKDGRRDGGEFAAVPQMVSGEELSEIEGYYMRLGWDRSRFDAWLRSPHSPLKKSYPEIRTRAEANRVRWALIGMLKARKLWEERKPA